MSQVPQFTLEHIEGAPVAVSSFVGRPVVVLIAGQHSRDQADAVIAAVRSRFGPEDLPVVQVAHLKGVPRLVQGIAKRDIRKSFKKQLDEQVAALQAAGRPVADDPSKVVIMVCDWKGEVAAGFGVDGVEKQALAALVDGSGDVRGTWRGGAGGPEILSMLA